MKFWPFPRESRASLENPRTSLANPAKWLVELFGGGPTPAGVSVSEETAVRMAAVYACVRILAETIASLPLQVYERDAEDERKLRRDHPVAPLLSLSPNEFNTAFIYREIQVAHCALWGNHYSRIEMTRGGRPIGLLPLMPWRVKPTRQAGILRYEVTLESGGREVLPPEEVLHIPALGWDGLKGLSPIAQVRNSVALGIAAEDFGSRFFGNDARPGIVISYENKLGDALDKLEERVKARFSGGVNRFKAMILDHGAKIHDVGIPPEDAQFLETRKFQVEEIARIYRMPLSFLQNLDKANFSNSEQQDIHFSKHTIAPWLRRIEAEENRKLFSPSDAFYAEHNIDGLQRGDFKTRTEGYQRAILSGWMTRAEARKLENLPKVDGLDEPLQPLNMATPADAAAQNDGGNDG